MPTSRVKISMKRRRLSRSSSATFADGDSRPTQGSDGGRDRAVPVRRISEAADQRLLEHPESLRYAPSSTQALTQLDRVIAPEIPQRNMEIRQLARWCAEKARRATRLEVNPQDGSVVARVDAKRPAVAARDDRAGQSLSGLGAPARMGNLESIMVEVDDKLDRAAGDNTLA
jgi:hypothetical protein